MKLQNLFFKGGHTSHIGNTHFKIILYTFCHPYICMGKLPCSMRNTSPNGGCCLWYLYFTSSRNTCSIYCSYIPICGVANAGQHLCFETLASQLGKGCLLTKGTVFAVDAVLTNVPSFQLNTGRSLSHANTQNTPKCWDSQRIHYAIFTCEVNGILMSHAESMLEKQM